MVKILTLFNIVAGMASIVGVIGGIYITEIEWPQEFLLFVFIFTGFLCLYVLLVPDTFFERNVRGKIEHYKNSINKENSDILIQRGILRIRGLRTTVEFDMPFAEVPEFELIDLPASQFAVGVTAQSVMVKRKGTNDSKWYRSRWIARGIPLERIQK